MRDENLRDFALAAVLIGGRRAGIHSVIPRKLPTAARLARHGGALPCDWRLLAALAVPPFLLGLREGFRALRAIVGMMFG